MSWPSIDHSILSPNGRVSKKAREAAIKRCAELLFPNGFPRPTCEQPGEKDELLRRAAELRSFADRGMKPRAYRKEAERLEAQAAAIA
jgi:hypothetical protein